MGKFLESSNKKVCKKRHYEDKGVHGRVTLQLIFSEYEIETLASKKCRVFLAEELLPCQEGLIPMQKIDSR
jgi:hypothetical protein